MQARELERAVSEFLRVLPERECSVFLRRYFFVEPVSQIGRRYGLKEGHVLVILSRTRQKLREFLRKEEYV